MLRAAGSVAIVLVLVSTVRPAVAAPPVDLEWDAPAECPTTAAVSIEIERVLARASTSDARLAVVARAFRVGDEKWRVELVLRGSEWEARRALEGPTCAAVAEAAALVVALAAEPQVERSPSSSPEPDRTTPESVAVPPSKLAGPSAGVGAVMDVGALPLSTFGVEATVAWRIGPTRVALAGSYFTARSGTFPDRDDTGARFHLGSVNARACYELDRGRVSFGPCAEVALLWTRAQGFGPIAPSQVSSTTPAIGAGLGAEWLVSRVFVPYARIGGLAPLLRPEYAVQGMGLIHRAAPLAFRGSIGIEFHF